MDPGIEEKIRARAYAVWEQEGRPHGKHVEHWERAKRMVFAEELLAAGGGVVTHPELAAHALEERDE